MQKAKKILVENSKLLERAGCEINGIACNTAHLLLPDLLAESSLEFLPIPKLVCKRVKQLGAERVGLLASPTTLASSLFDEALKDVATIVRPSSVVANRLEQLIFKQLEDAVTPAESAEFKSIIEEFRDSNDVKVVILGCTELPLVVGKHKDDQMLDTLQLLADGLVEAAMS